MADRIPLIVDSSTQQIKELPTNDNLDLTSSGIIGVTSVTATSTIVGSAVTINSTGINAGGVVGIITATSFRGDGSQLTGVGGEVDITASLFS